MVDEQSITCTISLPNVGYCGARETMDSIQTLRRLETSRSVQLLVNTTRVMFLLFFFYYFFYVLNLYHLMDVQIHI